MSLVRRLARPLLAAPFVSKGVLTLRDPRPRIEAAPSTFAKLDAQLSRSNLPVTVEQSMKILAGVTAGAGVVYAAGKVPRLAALTLLGTSVAAFSARAPFWKLSGAERDHELQRLITDGGLLGGVLLAAVDTAGKPSLTWRAQHLIERGQKRAAKRARTLKKAAGASGTVLGASGTFAGKATKTASKKGSKKLAKDARKKAAKRSQQLGKDASRARGALRSQAHRRSGDLQALIASGSNSLGDSMERLAANLESARADREKAARKAARSAKKAKKA